MEFVSHHKLLGGMLAVVVVTSFAPGAFTAAQTAADNVRDSASAFDRAFEFTLKKEGGYSNHAADIGGATMQGVTQQTYDSFRQRKGLSSQAVAQISKDEIREIYHQYWKDGKCGDYKGMLASACFDSVINFGVAGGKSFFDNLPEEPTAAALEVVRRRKAYRQERVNENPSQRVFLVGWLNRDKALEEKIRGGNAEK